MKRIVALVLISLALSQIAMAQSSMTVVSPTPPTMPDPPKIPTDTAGAHASGVTVYNGGQGGNASVNIGGIGAGASVEGVAVINGKVFIDGEPLSDNVTRFTSKTGQKYRIDRTGGVHVYTE